MEPASFQTWRDFFDYQAPVYEENSFTKNTLVEVQFLTEVMDLQPGMSVLDMGCGTGRHSIELARRGLRVVGVDFSGQMLFEAKRAAQRAGVSAEFVEADATEYRHPEPVDAAICLCEGGFGLIGHNEDPLTHDISILRNIADSVREGGMFVLTALNGYAPIRRASQEEVEVGAFDPATLVRTYQDQLMLPSGPVIMQIKERLWIPPELTAMLHHVGFAVEHVWGGTAGDWGKRPLKLDEIEAMYVCRKRV